MCQIEKGFKKTKNVPLRDTKMSQNVPKCATSNYCFKSGLEVEKYYFSTNFDNLVFRWRIFL